MASMGIEPYAYRVIKRKPGSWQRNGLQKENMTEIRTQDLTEYRRLLDDIGAEYCKAGTYCIFKEFLVAAHPSRRLLVQLKACDAFKYTESEKAGKDIGWQETLKRWVDQGWAAKFGEVYREDLAPREAYRLTMKKETK